MACALSREDRCDQRFRADLALMGLWGEDPVQGLRLLYRPAFSPPVCLVIDTAEQTLQGHVLPYPASHPWMWDGGRLLDPDVEDLPAVDHPADIVVVSPQAVATLLALLPRIPDDPELFELQWPEVVAGIRSATRHFSTE